MIIRLRSRLIIGALPDYHSSIVSGRIDIVIISDGKEIKDFQLYHNRYKAIKAIRHTSINPIIITSQYPDFLIFIKITIIGIKCHRTDCPAFTLLLSTQISELYKQKRQKTRKHQRDKQFSLFIALTFIHLIQ